MIKKTKVKDTNTSSKIEPYLESDANMVRNELEKYGLSNAKIRRSRIGQGRLLDNQRMILDLNQMKKYVAEQKREEMLSVIERAEKVGNFYKIWNEQEEVIWQLEYIIESEKIYFDFHTDCDAIYSESEQGEKWLESVYRSLINLGYDSEVQEIKLKQVFSSEEAEHSLDELVSEKMIRELYESFTVLEKMLVENLRESFKKIGEKISETNNVIKLIDNEEEKLLF